MKKQIVILAATCMALNTHAGPMFSSEYMIGCGTITSVRKTNQRPMINDDLINAYSEKNINSTSTFAEAASSGVMSIGASVVGGILFDSVVNNQRGPSSGPKDGMFLGKKLQALRIELDDGREINLPLIEARVVSFLGKELQGHAYEPGRRVYIAYNTQFKTIQIDHPRYSPPPKQGEEDYLEKCGLRIDKEFADGVVAKSRRSVIERFIIDELTKADASNTN